VTRLRSVCCFSVSQCVLQCVAVCCSVLQCVAVCAAVCCRVLQCVVSWQHGTVSVVSLQKCSAITNHVSTCRMQRNHAGCTIFWDMTGDKQSNASHTLTSDDFDPDFDPNSHKSLPLPRMTVLSFVIHCQKWQPQIMCPFLVRVCDALHLFVVCHDLWLLGSKSCLFTCSAFTSHDAWMRCNTLQHTATHCNTLQHTATHCNRHDFDPNIHKSWWVMSHSEWVMMHWSMSHVSWQLSHDALINESCPTANE